MKMQKKVRDSNPQYWNGMPVSRSLKKRLEKRDEDILIYNLSCRVEDESKDERVRYCKGLHPSCCEDCTKSKKHITKMIKDQKKNAIAVS
jgi:hypothetical protein